MTAPDYALQDAVFDALVADAGVGALIGDRIYDRVPAEPVFPYCSFGPSDITDVSDDCTDAWEIFLQIDCWSRAVGFPEVRQIAKAVRDALHDAELTLTDNALAALELQGNRTFRDPDGLTSHAALTLRALIEAA